MPSFGFTYYDKEDCKHQNDEGWMIRPCMGDETTQAIISAKVIPRTNEMSPISQHCIRSLNCYRIGFSGP